VSGNIFKKRLVDTIKTCVLLFYFPFELFTKGLNTITTVEKHKFIIKFTLK
jgi:hypothetical protein